MKIIKLLEETLDSFGFGDAKILCMKEKISKLYFIKIQNFYLVKDTVMGMEILGVGENKCKIHI